MILLANNTFEGWLDISSDEVLGKVWEMPYRNTMAAGQVLFVPDEFYQFPNIRNAVSAGYLTILAFDSRPWSMVVNAELDGFVGGGSMKETITQPGHGFAPGQAVYIRPDETWGLAQADDEATSEALGIIESVAADTFVVVYGGPISNMSGLSAGALYYLSETVAGGLQTTEPECCPSISKPLLVGKNATGGVVVVQRSISNDESDEGRRWMGM